MSTQTKKILVTVVVELPCRLKDDTWVLTNRSENFLDRELDTILVDGEMPSYTVLSDVEARPTLPEDGVEKLRQLFDKRAEERLNGEVELIASLASLLGAPGPNGD